MRTACAATRDLGVDRLALLGVNVDEARILRVVEQAAEKLLPVAR